MDPYGRYQLNLACLAQEISRPRLWGALLTLAGIGVVLLFSSGLKWLSRRLADHVA
jgi:hypothetical protein